MHYDEDSLIAAIRTGDTDAFRVLIERYQDRIIRVLYLLVNNLDDAEDIAQETFVRAYRYIGTFKGRSAFTTWLHRIAINTARNWMRDTRRRSEMTIPLEKAQIPDSHDPQDIFLANERQSDIRQALARLPEHYRSTVILRYNEDISYQEIAEIQQVPVGTVRSRLAKARALLQKSLGSDVISKDERVTCSEMQDSEREYHSRSFRKPL